MNTGNGRTHQHAFVSGVVMV